MLLKDLLKLVGDEMQNIALIDKNDWLGTFPCCYVPTEYDHYCVTSISPDNFNGDFFGSGLVLKIWIEDSQ